MELPLSGIGERIIKSVVVNGEEIRDLLYDPRGRPHDSLEENVPVSSIIILKGSSISKMGSS